MVDKGNQALDPAFVASPSSPQAVLTKGFNRGESDAGDDNELADGEQPQAEPAQGNGAGSEVPLSQTREETGGTRLLQGSTDEILEDLIDQASRLRGVLITLGKKYPEEGALDAAYILALGIHNRGRKIRVRLNALAAGSGTAETNEDSAQCEASQSGLAKQGNAQPVVVRRHPQ
jgi:hypothetical protein